MQNPTIQIIVEASKEPWWITISQLAGVFIALIAVVFTAWQSRLSSRSLKEAEESRRLSIAPSIQLEPYTGEHIPGNHLSALFTTSDKEPHISLALYFSNIGKGTAYNLCFETLNGVPFESGFIGTISNQYDKKVLMIYILRDTLTRRENVLVIKYENEFGEIYIQEIYLELVVFHDTPAIKCEVFIMLQPKLNKQSVKGAYRVR